MKIEYKIWFLCFVVLFFACNVFALQPAEILIVANKNNPKSVELANYYSLKRDVPEKNILLLDLKEPLASSVSRLDYDKLIAEPIRQRLQKDVVETFNCVLLTYGVPYKVGRRVASDKDKKTVKDLTSSADKLAGRVNSILNQIEQLGFAGLKKIYTGKPLGRKNVLAKIKSKFDAAKKRIVKMEPGAVRSSHQRNIEKFQDELFAKAGLANQLTTMNLQIDYYNSRETNASVDSELSMVRFEKYELYRWQPNRLKGVGFGIDFKTIMVSRLDGPSFEISKGLIDKAMIAEKIGLNGKGYFDSRGITPSRKPGSYGFYDLAVRNAADIVRAKGFQCVEDRSGALFKAGQCPQTALYCGWYSLKKYIDAFDFVTGAVGYHIASWEAVNLRDPNSSQWCPAMLVDGITATLGAVDEPYLGAFPAPDRFFAELLDGKCLAEAYYRTKPYNSWMMLLIGDPLYNPFEK